MDENGEEFVAYFLPSEKTIVKLREDIVENRSYDDDYEYQYKMIRKYNWNFKNKSNKGYDLNYFFIIRQDGIFYNELETRFGLNIFFISNKYLHIIKHKLQSSFK